jgi:hypothetical protein
VLAALILALFALGGGPALADAPTRVTDQITDEAGVLGSGTATRSPAAGWGASRATSDAS